MPGCKGQKGERGDYGPIGPQVCCLIDTIISIDIVYID